MIEKLIDVNLLCRINISIGDVGFENYFLPFLKPGVSINYLATENNPTGYPVLDFLNSILEKRELRIKAFINKEDSY